MVGINQILAFINPLTLISPLLKNEMYSGSWTIVILGNNGNSSSFAAYRTFELLVGPQATVTFTPTGK